MLHISLLRNSYLQMEWYLLQSTMSNKTMTQILKVKLLATKSEVFKLRVLKYQMITVHTKDPIRWKRKLQQVTLTLDNTSA